MFAPFLVAILVILAAVSALFSGFETALFSLRSFQIRRLNERNPRLAQGLERLMENPRKLLSAILFADSITNLPLIILSIILMRDVLPAFVPFWLMALVIFAVIVLLCDLIPKLVALRQPYRIAQIGVVVLGACMPVVDPVLRVLQSWSEKIAGALTPAKFQSHNVLNQEELGTLAQLSAEEGSLQESESRVIREIIKLGDKIVKDCMTPRIDAFTIPDDLENGEVITRLHARRYRRVPVYAETPDNIVGILDAKMFLANPGQPYMEALIPPSFVPETMKALDLLRSFLTHRQGLAVIIDEFGGTEGIITLADLVEEIIGDAVPSGNREFSVEHVGEDRVLVSGATRLDDLSELGFYLEEDGIDTVGGLIFNRLGYLPKSGASIRIDDVKLTVRTASRKRIEEVMVARATEENKGEVSR